MSTLNVSVEVSARHIHLSQEDIERLFGKGYELKVKKEIAGGFVAEERVTLVGPKRAIDRVAILGPARKETQIELTAVHIQTCKCSFFYCCVFFLCCEVERCM